jgi:opacity protein-like surface antigen
MKRIIIMLALFLSTTAVFSQMNMLAVAWDINFPSNNGYLTKTSYAGGKIDYRHVLKHKNISIGLSLDWASYEQYLPKQTFEKPDGNGAVTSDFVAQVYQVPFVATMHYYFTESKRLKPFAGIGLGASYMEQSLFYNVYESDENNWGFIARPELGAIVKFKDSGWGLLVGANYSIATNKTESINRDSFNSFGINLGFVFME